MRRSVGLDALHSAGRKCSAAVYCGHEIALAREMHFELNGALFDGHPSRTSMDEDKMLISAKRYHGFRMIGVDDDVGTVKDLLFRDDRWIVEYLDIDTGKWLPDRRVILPPAVVKSVDYSEKTLRVHLTRNQVREGPPLESDMPVSHKMELALSQYYAWGDYAASKVPGTAERLEEEMPGVRSTKTVTGYRVAGTDGEFGYVDDFLVDEHDLQEESWHIRYFVVGARKWLPGGKCLLSTEWIDRIEWVSSCVQVDLTEESIKASPEFDPERPINRRYEEVLYDHYGRPKYWKQTTGASPK